MLSGAVDTSRQGTTGGTKVMTSRSRGRALRSAVVLGSIVLLVAACGSDDKSSSTTAGAATSAGAATTAAAGAATTAAGGSATTAAGAATTAGGAATTAGSTAGGSSGGTAGCGAVDTSLDADNGKGAGLFKSNIECAAKKPLAAQGDPITIGIQNPEGDPNGSFPEYTVAMQAAADYINKELGGLGADIQNGKPGRPVKLEVCKTAVTPDDSQRCANELLTKKPAMVFSTINFFGNQIPIYNAGKVPVIVITPITVADFTSTGTYSIGGGGGCLGAHTGMVYYATQTLKAQKVSIPWADTPPGAVCY